MSPWAGKHSYSFGKNVILAESLQQPFSGGGSLWRRSFLLTGKEKDIEGSVTIDKYREQT